MPLKGVIVAAGYGSRFLPVTKTVPKEMLPVINIPSIDFIVNEFLEAGIKEIVIVTHRKKKSLEDYFDRDPELEAFFAREGKNDLLSQIKPVDARIAFIRQQEMKGTGDAVLAAEAWMGDHPFVVAFPDDLVLGSPGLTAQMVKVYEKHQKSVLSAMEIKGDVSRYGVIDFEKRLDERTCLMRGIVEKPKPGTEPSKLVSIGRYLFTPEIFDRLKACKKDHISGEFFLTDGILELAKEGRAVSYEFTGKRLDTGKPEGYLEATLEYAFTRPELKKMIIDFVKARE